MNRLANLLIGAATADIGDSRINVFIGRLGVRLQKRSDRHDHAALAIATLRHFIVEPCLLHTAEDAVLCNAFDGGDLLAADLADGDLARALCYAVDMNGAGAALGNTATIFGAGEAERIAQCPQQRRASIDLCLIHFSVDVERRHFNPPYAALRGRTNLPPFGVKASG